jgi:hypothetical protein
MTQHLVALSLVLVSVGACLPPGSGQTTADDTAGPTPAGPVAPSSANGNCIDPGTCSAPNPTAAPPNPMPAQPLACPPGQTLVYAYAMSAGGAENFISGVKAGPGGASMTTSCQATTCASGQVAVNVPSSEFSQRDGTDPSQSAGGIVCVEPPPSCVAGEYVAYMPGSSDLKGVLGSAVAAGWHCTGPCDLVVQYGPLYGGRTVCAPAKPSCAAGTMATFDASDEAWHCDTQCGPGYDVDQYGGGGVCVPC